ncbi:MAG: hypothetical protein INR73_19705 [Williamsia sp.]|nr:hypothetical protein [Williamsia sp.]
MAAFFLSVVIITFTRTLLKHHKKRLAVYKDKVSTEITILEIERQRMAVDLHDDLGALLSSIKLQLTCLNNTDPEDFEIVEKCTYLIEEALQKILETSRNLTSKVLVREGLIQAIREFLAMIGKTKKLEVDVDIQITQIRLNESGQLHVYRIFQEVLTNCLKHAKATKFYLQIVQEEQWMKIHMKDNGDGFNLQEVESAWGFGLKNIVNRVDILNGRLFLDAQKDKGVSYTIEIPLPV